MYITINDIIGEARIDLSYPIKGKKIAACLAIMFSIGYRSVAQNGQENCVE